MDLAIAYLVTETLRDVSLQGRFIAEDQLWTPQRLAEILWRVVKDGGNAIIEDTDYLAAWGCSATGRTTAQEVWAELVERLPAAQPSIAALLRDARWLVERGSLSQRLLRAVGVAPRPEQLRDCYATLAICLASGQRFETGL